LGVPTFVALLRAVNVGGRATVPMAALRGLAATLGLERPETLLQSGNLVFGAPSATPASLERALQGAIADTLGVRTEVMIRTDGEWDEVIARNPFRAEATADPSHLLVMALKRAPKAGDVDALCAAIKGRELVKANGRELYLVYPDGIGRSKLTAAVIEKAVGAPGTARNWNTVVKLAGLCDRR